MKVRLVSTLCAGLLCATAHAQSSVQLYGVIDLGVAHYNNGAGSVNLLGTGMFVPSLIGLKGTEDLGGGMSVIFQAETGFCANGGPLATTSPYCTGGYFMGRTSMLGLKGNFGTIKAGRIYDLTHDDQVAVDPFQYGLLGSLDGPIGSLGAPGNLSQTVTYLSPSIGGLNLGATYVFGEGVTGTTASNSGGYNFHIGYRQGPVLLAADYLNLKAAGVVTVKHSMIIGAYDFGIATISGMYAQNSPDGVSGNPKLKSYMLGLTVPIGAGSVLASYTKLKNDSQSNANANQWAFGYTYALSKQTNLYTAYSRISNQQSASYIVNDSTGNNNAPLGTNGPISSGLIVGMMHSF